LQRWSGVFGTIRFEGKYFVCWMNKPMPSLDPQTPRQGILTNKTAAIQGFVEANLLEAYLRAVF
jgi:hypothetical protein